ncbi:MAG: hypothetical protein U5N85_01720 [Arcicella sp.]|nr:hypothetical protein [Arcicella sp.]
MWQSLAERIEGKFIEGNSWKNEKVILNYKNRIITLSSELKTFGSRNTYFESQVECLFIHKNKFTLKIFLENAFTHAGKIL